MKAKLLTLLTSATLLSLVLCLFASKKSTPDLSVVGYIQLADGLGRQGPELVDAFSKELKINYHLTRKIKNKKEKKKYNQYIAKTPNEWGKVVIFEEMLSIPWDGFYPAKKLSQCPQDRIKIAYTMWESSEIPEEWVKILNTQFDAAIVPSEFLVKVYEKGGVGIPIFTIPLALDFKHYFSSPLKTEANSPFVFANFSGVWNRKNHLTLIKAFNQAFGSDPSVKLIINSRTAEPSIAHKMTKLIAEYDSSNIEFTRFTRSKKHYLDIFKTVDCYVSPSKGEGFSIQPREAMALGIPVIATNNTGQIEVCRSGLVESVPSEIEKQADYPFEYCCGNNYDCSVDDLATAMVNIKRNYNTYVARAEESRLWAKQFEYSHLKPLYANLIHPKKVILGKENKVTSECLMTTSKELFDKYQAFSQ